MENAAAIVSREPLIANASEREKLKYQCDLISRLGQILAASGAETRLILSSMTILAAAFKLKAHCAVNRAGVFVTLDAPDGNGQVFSFRRIKAFGINMTVVTYCHKLCLKAEKGEITDLKEIEDALNHLPSSGYPKPLLVFIDAAAGGAFAYLNGGGLEVIFGAFVGALVLMSLRFYLASRGFFDAFIFMASAFLGGLAAVLAAKSLGADSNEMTLALLASSLVLMPGYPLINSFLDFFKGYIDTGITRLVQALVLIAHAGIGILGVILLASYYWGL